MPIPEVTKYNKNIVLHEKCTHVVLIRVETNCSLVISNTSILNERIFEYFRILDMKFKNSYQAKKIQPETHRATKSTDMVYLFIKMCSHMSCFERKEKSRTDKLLRRTSVQFTEQER